MRSKRKLLLTAAFTALLGVGVFTGVSLTKEAKPAEVQADDPNPPSSYTNVYRFTVPDNNNSPSDEHKDWGHWTALYLHAWGSSGGNTSWGNFIKLNDYSFNENSERVFTYATNYTYTGFIMIRYGDNPDYCKSNDISVGNNTAWSWGGPGGNASAWTPVNQTYYLYDYRNLFGGNAKCYAWQSNGSLNNGKYPGVAMTSVQYGSGQLYSVSLDPAFDEFKLGIGDSSNTGDLWINQHRGECYCFWETNPGWSTDLDWVKAHDWVLNTMHIRDIPTTTDGDTGACRGSSGYYQKAKTAYNNFTDAVKAKFASVNEYSDAQTRFVAWAKANGETATFNETALTVNAVKIPYVDVTNNASTTIIVIVISSIALVAIGGYFLLRKKKED